MRCLFNIGSSLLPASPKNHQHHPTVVLLPPGSEFNIPFGRGGISPLACPFLKSLLPSISSFLAPSRFSILGSSFLLSSGSARISWFDLDSSSPFLVQAFWGFMFSLISKTSIRERSRVWGVSSSGLTNRSTRTLPPLATSSSTQSDFSSPPSAPQSAPPVNSIR